MLRLRCSGQRSGDALSNFSKLNKEDSKSSPGRDKHWTKVEIIRQKFIFVLLCYYVSVKITYTWITYTKPLSHIPK